MCPRRDGAATHNLVETAKGRGVVGRLLDHLIKPVRKRHLVRVSLVDKRSVNAVALRPPLVLHDDRA
jgi:hypothetical protein